MLLVNKTNARVSFTSYFFLSIFFFIFLFFFNYFLVQWDVLIFAQARNGACNECCTNAIVSIIDLKNHLQSNVTHVALCAIEKIIHSLSWSLFVKVPKYFWLFSYWVLKNPKREVYIWKGGTGWKSADWDAP